MSRDGIQASMRIKTSLYLMLTVLLVVSGCAAPSYKPSALGDFPPQPKGFEDNLRKHVQVLAGDIGPRNAFLPEAKERAAKYIEDTFRAAGLEVRRQPVTIPGIDMGGGKAFEGFGPEFSKIPGLGPQVLRLAPKPLKASVRIIRIIRGHPAERCRALATFGSFFGRAPLSSLGAQLSVSGLGPDRLAFPP